MMIPMMTDIIAIVSTAYISVLYCSASSGIPEIMSMAVGMSTDASRITYIRAVSMAMIVLSNNSSGSAMVTNPFSPIYWLYSQLYIFAYPWIYPAGPDQFSPEDISPPPSPPPRLLKLSRMGLMRNTIIDTIMRVGMANSNAVYCQSLSTSYSIVLTTI